MASENGSSKTPDTRRRSRWAATSTPYRPRRMAFRLIGIPILALAGVFIYRGLQDHLSLPACDSGRAKETLSEVLKQLKLEPVRYEPIKTVSSSDDKVVCNAVLPLPDGGSVIADYTFYWQGGKANMKYSIHRQAAQGSTLSPPRAG